MCLHKDLCLSRHLRDKPRTVENKDKTDPFVSNVERLGQHALELCCYVNITMNFFDKLRDVDVRSKQLLQIHYIVTETLLHLSNRPSYTAREFKAFSQIDLEISILPFSTALSANFFFKYTINLHLLLRLIYQVFN